MYVTVNTTVGVVVELPWHHQSSTGVVLNWATGDGMDAIAWDRVRLIIVHRTLQFLTTMCLQKAAA
jgi:hypothetical protein